MWMKYWLTAYSIIHKKKSVGSWTDRPDMTIAVEWDVMIKPNQTTLHKITGRKNKIKEGTKKFFTLDRTSVKSAYQKKYFPYF